MCMRERSRQCKILNVVAVAAGCTAQQEAAAAGPDTRGQGEFHYVA